jgi:hypothetical protein
MDHIVLNIPRETFDQLWATMPTEDRFAWGGDHPYGSPGPVPVSLVLKTVGGKDVVVRPIIDE